MKVQSALLCDAASVREGLLHILGGGVTSGARPFFPAPLGVTLAVVYEMEGHDPDSQVEIKVVVSRVDAMEVPILELDGDLGVGLPPPVEAGVPLLLPLVIDLGGLPVPEEGTYSIRVFNDGSLGADLRIFLRTEPPPVPVT